MNIKKISIEKICGEDIISRAAGKKFRKELISNWDNDRIEIIMDKRLCSMVFFDEAIALLIKEENKSIQEICRKLSFPNITDDDRKLLNYTITTRVDEVDEN